MATMLVKHSWVMPASDHQLDLLKFRSPARVIAHDCKCALCKPFLYEQARHPQDLERLKDPHPPLKMWSHEIFSLATMTVKSFSYDEHEHLSFGQLHAQNMWKGF